mmetsp:Transcript_12210/g.26934  ORF Transcript_12210/g.26934 Transcript_12210/m.26934 type:complete len:158 (+) Transcript_12210:104-577(+)
MPNRHGSSFDIDQYLITKENKDDALHTNIYYHELENHFEEDVGAICSKGRVLKEKHRRKEGQILATVRHADKEEEDHSQVDYSDSSSVSSACTVSDCEIHHDQTLTMKTRELCEITARKKKQVGQQRRKFREMELQVETLKALQTATSRYEALRSAS